MVPLEIYKKRPPSAEPEKTTALSRKEAARLRMVIISLCCCAADSPGRDGQSILYTVAIQTPRNSRKGAVGCKRGSDEIQLI